MTTAPMLYPDLPDQRRAQIRRDVVTALLLVAVLPRRIRGIREMTAARSMTDLSLDDPEHRRLLAMRAAFGLPFRDLLPHTRDPFGDVAAGRYDALVAAALAEVGLSPVRPASR